MGALLRSDIVDMTVGQLRAELERFPVDAPVIIASDEDEGLHGEIEWLFVGTDEGYVAVIPKENVRS